MSRSRPGATATDLVLDLVAQSKSETIQGGALRAYPPFDPTANGVIVLPRTDGTARRRSSRGRPRGHRGRRTRQRFRRGAGQADEVC
jgi:hypothetical protein